MAGSPPSTSLPFFSHTFHRGVEPRCLNLCLRWKDEDLEEIMNAEYVISEVNGIMTYSYSLTAATANCRSQPQNWSAIRAQWDKHTGHPSFWNREVGRIPPTQCWCLPATPSLRSWRLMDPLQSKLEGSLGRILPGVPGRVK